MADINELHDWIVTYDNHGMPGSIQGIIPGKNPKSAAIDVFSLDLESNIAVDHAGNSYILVGDGTQALFLNHTEPFSFVKMLDEDDFDPFDPGDDGEETEH